MYFLKIAAAAVMACMSAVSVVHADEATGSGTGFAVTKDGWLLTNAHVIDGCERIEANGKTISTDPRVDSINDLALIKLQLSEPARPFVFRQSPTRLGEDIVAIGYPLMGLLSDSIKVTTGNVNSLAGLRNDTRYIQISTPIQPGNSGGPIIDRDGYLLGITTATFSKKTADELGITAQNINFALKASVADLFLQSQNIVGESANKPADQPALSTADLTAKMATSVFQIRCFGKPAGPSPSRQEEVAASAPKPSAAQSTLINASGYDAIGFDYVSLRAATYSGCRAACEGDERCKAITYNTKHSVCFLKNNVVALIRNKDAMAAYSASKAADVILSEFTSYSGVDIPGGDYKRIRQSTYLGCFVSCIGEKACKAFSFIPKKKECWLKDTLGRPQIVKGVELGLK
ncbi:MAG TPA: trypsin-like peptidase domain-containing protein [Mesorhizobium sp.]|jgi:hypothetical protein|uniref:trypsin-like peptidase domain-containing protein n=1 Tax=Mesorhizobium sp. TaxID=1871066 RepID=UPI002DDD3535|nr:trypsin-like peptidase domain-containing protein [Mesorhizobium sp.]HEV2504788.1 trypsin-like peptidase domain-containing protein [Mesorhizobium sp.]